MFKETKKHVFFIEGGDNVGKTTTIEALKRSGNIDDLKYNRISFSKYPTYKATDRINELRREMKENEKIYREYKECTRYQYQGNKKAIIHKTIKFMISDMMDSFTNVDNDQYAMQYPDDILNICDRGFLSTYLYQYRSLPGVPKFILGEDNELKYLQNFINQYVPDSYNDLNVIILNNNANPLHCNMIVNTQETIEYKKDFDNDVELQLRINSSLNNIVGLIENNKLDCLLPIHFYYVNIFDGTGSIRKTSNEVCKEIISIINKEELTNG